VNTVNNDVGSIISAGEAIGLKLNQAKCEVICNAAVPAGLAITDFLHVSPNQASLLGVPLLNGPALDDAISDHCAELTKAHSKLPLIAAHDALLLTKVSLGLPKIQHTLRASKCAGHPMLAKVDDIMQSCISHITNCDLSANQWAQATLPVKLGGLGVRRASDIAPSAYLASYSEGRKLVASILHIPQAETLDPSILNLWNRLSNDSPPPLGDSAFKQRNWDLPVAETTFNRLLNQGDKARLLAVSADHSSDWLHAIPISSCGLRLEDEAIRVAVGLRLGCNLCLPHKCPCGTEVEDNGRHGLSCKKSGARTLRHNALNDVIHRALVKGGVPSTKEPTGLIRTVNVPMVSPKFHGRQESA